jgi:hypothetical protein
MRSWLILSLLIFVLSCSDVGVEVPTPPPDIPIEQLLAVPETTLVDGHVFVLSTYLWRDFQPIAPPDGKPLIALAYIDVIDTTRFPTTISSDALWIVWSNQVWKTYFTQETPPQDPPGFNRLARIAREGPKWGPHVYVDVVVRIFDAHHNPHFLRATQQWIGRAD